MTGGSRPAMFPEPGRLVVHALADLEVLRDGPAAAKAALGNSRDLPRPWDPATCPRALLRPLMYWFDACVEWVNRQYCWQPGPMIPACWPLHPHIVNELAVLVCLRHEAGAAAGPGAIEDWHRYSLPMFLDRMQARLLSGGCDNNHTDWPGRGRDVDYQGAEQVELRQKAFHDLYQQPEEDDQNVA